MLSVPVSVLMPVYNREEYVGDAIRSILVQTYADFELLIVNDGSTDKTREVIESFSDKRIKVFHTRNRGWAAALRTGMSHAKGEYLARMDSDDLSVPKRLARQKHYLDQHPNVALVHSLVDYINTSGEIVKRRVGSCFNDAVTKWHLLWRNIVVHPTVMIRVSVLKNHGLNYLPERYRAEEFDLWNKIARVADIHCIPEVLLRYRVHAGSATNNNPLDAQFDVYRDVIQDNLALYGVDITQLTAAELAIISAGTQVDPRYHRYTNLTNKLHLVLLEADEKFRNYHKISPGQLDAAQALQLVMWARYMLNTSKRYAATLLCLGMQREYGVLFSAYFWHIFGALFLPQSAVARLANLKQKLTDKRID